MRNLNASLGGQVCQKVWHNIICHGTKKKTKTKKVTNKIKKKKKFLLLLLKRK